MVDQKRQFFCIYVVHIFAWRRIFGARAIDDAPLCPRYSFHYTKFSSKKGYSIDDWKSHWPSISLLEGCCMTSYAITVESLAMLTLLATDQISYRAEGICIYIMYIILLQKYKLQKFHPQNFTGIFSSRWQPAWSTCGDRDSAAGYQRCVCYPRTQNIYLELMFGVWARLGLDFATSSIFYFILIYFMGKLSPFCDFSQLKSGVDQMIQ